MTTASSSSSRGGPNHQRGPRVVAVGCTRSAASPVARAGGSTSTASSTEAFAAAGVVAVPIVDPVSERTVSLVRRRTMTDRPALAATVAALASEAAGVGALHGGRAGARAV